MDVRYINPFIDAVRSVFSTMVHLDVELGHPLRAETLPQCDVSGIIGMSGDIVGSVVLCFPTPVAVQVISRFAATDLRPSDPVFADALGELVNMISGAAKARFDGKKVSISTPSVVIGAGHTIARPARTSCISLPCRVLCGQFSLDVAIREQPQAAFAA